MTVSPTPSPAPRSVAKRPVLGFGTRLFAALIAVVGLVLVITLAAVTRATTAQVRAAAERVLEQSGRAFREMEALQQLEIAQLGRSFTSSPRTSAALEAALESGDMHWLAETARYELALSMLPRSLAVFTDAGGTPVITLIDGTHAEDDIARIRPLVADLIEENAAERLAYRVVHDALYLVQVQPLDLDGHIIGAVAFGLPLEDDAADKLGTVLGAELCFVADGRCLAGTTASDRAFRSLLIQRAHAVGNVAHGSVAAGGAPGLIIRRADGRWLVAVDHMDGAAPADAWRVMAVPIEHVLRPFADVRHAIQLAGLGALLLALLLSVLLSRGLVRPVRALVAATQCIGRGDYEARVTLQRRDELGSLAGAFNTMAEGLQLKERYRGVLDKVVSPQVAHDLMQGEIRLGGETREVTTLFADITAFSTLVDGMEPQRVIGLLNECMARLESVVHAHDGVVDKYIGDEIMAIFGAPVAGPDDVLHALDAALAMQHEVGRLNVERAARGELPIAITVGVHTGPAVAGNMGSPNRLNYTVVGDSVNLAKRLCSAAAPGQVLATESTWQRVAARAAERMRAHPAGVRSFKGFAAPLRVVSLEGNVLAPAGAAAPPDTARRVHALLVGLLFGAASLLPVSSHAQTSGLPTLEELGLRYASPGGAFQAALGGRLDIEAYVPQDEPAWLVPTTHPFVAGRLRLFTDLFVGERVYGLVEARADRGHAPADAAVSARIEQVFIRVRASAAPAIALQAGKFASPFGAWAARHHTDADPLIRPPLPYDARTLASPHVLPGGLDGFLGWKETAAERRAAGAPVIWDVPYPWGALATVGVGSVGARVAVTGNAPSGGPGTWTLSDRLLRKPNLTVALAWQVVPDLALGAAWNRGPWLEPPSSGTLPAGARLSDFVQETLAFDAAFARGRTAIRAELFRNRWEVPNVDEDALDISFYIETSTRIATGLFVAGRYGEIRFNRMGEGTAADRAGQRWDLNQRRLQLGGGYRIVRNAGIRAEYMLNRTIDGADPRDDMLSVQAWWTF